MNRDILNALYRIINIQDLQYQDDQEYLLIRGMKSDQSYQMLWKLINHKFMQKYDINKMYFNLKYFVQINV